MLPVTASLRIVLIVFLVGLAPAFAESAPVYAPSTIEGLLAKKAWAELVMRLDEAPPAQRNGQWELWVETASMGYVQDLIGQKVKNLDRMCDNLISRYACLSKSSSFAQVCRKLVLQSLEDCYRNPKNKARCRKKAYDQALRRPKDSVLVRELAAKVKTAEQASASAKVFLVGARNDSVFCAEQSFWQSITDAIVENPADDWATEIKVTKCTSKAAKELADRASQKPPAQARTICSVAAKLDPNLKGCARTRR